MGGSIMYYTDTRSHILCFSKIWVKNIVKDLYHKITFILSLKIIKVVLNNVHVRYNIVKTFGY